MLLIPVEIYNRPTLKTLVRNQHTLHRRIYEDQLVPVVALYSFSISSIHFRISASLLSEAS